MLAQLFAGARDREIQKQSHSRLPLRMDGFPVGGQQFSSTNHLFGSVDSQFRHCSIQSRYPTPEQDTILGGESNEYEILMNSHRIADGGLLAFIIIDLAIVAP